MTAKVVERVQPQLLDRPVGEIGDAEIFAFRGAGSCQGTKPSTVNRDLRTIQAMLKNARPEYRFPKGAFFEEDETRVHWLRPEEEILVLWNEWVFPNPDGRPYDRSYVGRVFRRVAQTVGLRSFTFHALRHHAATMALNKGFSAPIAMKLGGWKTERAMRRYAAVTDQTLRPAPEAVSGNEQWQQAENHAGSLR